MSEKFSLGTSCSQQGACTQPGSQPYRGEWVSEMAGESVVVVLSVDSVAVLHQYVIDVEVLGP